MYEGRLTVIAGCMFASKSDHLISFMTQEKFRKRTTLCFKPQRDTRYATDKIVSHNGVSMECIPVENAAAIEAYVEPWKQNGQCKMSLGIDEAQFFDPAIAPVLSTLAMDGFRIFVSGLDLDSFGHPFGSMPELMAYADKVIKLHAQCVICGENATRTYRKPDVTKDVVHVGGKDSYEPRCADCWKEEI